MARVCWRPYPRADARDEGIRIVDENDDEEHEVIAPGTPIR